MSTRLKERTAFTLVELLVVIGIIGLLISILLPALSKAREGANRIKCAANLRTLGQVCTLFANDHKGYFPTAWGYGQLQFSNVAVSIPVVLNYNPPNDDDLTTWKRFGSSYQGMLRYAPTSDGIDVTYLNPNPTGTFVKLASWLVCPSVPRAVLGSYQAWVNNGPYGYAIETSYAYVAGITPRKVGVSYGAFGPITNISGFNYGKRQPAVRLSDKAASSVLAADTVRWIGVPGSTYYQINHTSRSDITQAAFQNVLFGDGHVDGGIPGYTDSVTGSTGSVLTYNNYSLIGNPAYPPQGDYYYWGQ